MVKCVQRQLWALLLLALIVAFVGVGAKVYAAELADGTYTIDYLVKKPDDESVSIANDYWEKPATVIVSGGSITVQMTINHSHWVTVFKVPSGSDFVDTKVISRNEDKDIRTVQFSVDSLDELLAKIHVTIKDINYDHNYTIRFVFDKDTLKLLSEPDTEPQAEPTQTPAPTKEPSQAASKQPASAPEASVKSERVPTADAKAVTNAEQPPSTHETSGGKSTANSSNETAKPKQSKDVKSSAAGASGRKAQANESEEASGVAVQSGAGGTNNLSSEQASEGAAGQQDGNVSEAVRDDKAANDTHSDEEKVTEDQVEEVTDAVDSNQEMVELKTALDGASLDEHAASVAVNVSELPASKSGLKMIIIVLSILIIAGAVIAIAAYKRKAKNS